GALVMAFVRRHDPFDNDLAPRRHHETHGFRLHHFQWLTEKGAGDLHFRAYTRLLADGGHIQRRMMPNGESDLHWLVVIFILGSNVVAMVSWIDHQSELPFALFLMAVNADVDGAGAALFADQRGGVDVGAGVAFVNG